MEDFVKQMFAADLDALPSDQAAEAAVPGAMSAAAAPAAEQPPQPAAAAEPESAVATAALAAAPVLDAATAKRREKKLKRLLGEGSGGRGAKLYEAWLEANAEGVAAFRSAAGAALAQLAGRNYPARQAAVVELLLVWLFRSKRTHLLEPSEQDPSKLLAQLALEDAIALLTQSLGVRGGHVPGVLERCPALLGRQPPPESLEAFQELFGGRQELGAAVLRSPRILLMGVDMLKRRLEVLALLTHRSTREAAALVVEYPSLLGCGEAVLADNARFLGVLLPLRPYNTLLQRFPYLLSTPLERRLRGLQRYLSREAPELAAVNLELLVSQQPTLLLKGPSEVAAQWHLLRQAAASVPGWQSELEALSAPTLQAQQQAGGGSTAAAAAAADSGSGGEEQQLSEADQWLADMLSSLPGSDSGSGGEAASSQQASGEPEPEQPSWFHRDAAGEAAAVARGAFGTQQRPWAEGDRLRARQLARLLDARRWQVLRLLFLGETVGAEAGRRSLLDVVMAHLSAFEQAHPGFPDWLDEQLRREEEERLQAEEERERRRAERAAERAAAREQAAADAGEPAAAAGEAAGEEAVEGSWDAAAAAAAAGGEPGAGAAAGSEAAPDAAAAAAAQGQAGAAGAQPAAGAGPQP